MPKLYTPPEIAKKLGVSVLSVYAWMNGKLLSAKLLPSTAIKQDRSVRYYITEKDLVQWLSLYRQDLLPQWRNNKTLCEANEELLQENEELRRKLAESTSRVKSSTVRKRLDAAS